MASGASGVPSPGLAPLFPGLVCTTNGWEKLMPEGALKSVGLVITAMTQGSPRSHLGRWLPVSPKAALGSEYTG